MKKEILHINLLIVITILISNCMLAQKLTTEQVGIPINQAVHRTKNIGKALGDDCSNPFIIEVTTLPFTYTDIQENGTCGYGNNYDGDILNHHDDGEDVVYKFQVSQEVQVNISLVGTESSGGGYFHAIAIYEGCPDVGKLITYATANISNATITLSQALSPNTEYFVLVDYWGLNNDPCLTYYDITIEFTTDDIVHYYNLYIADEHVSSANASDLSVIPGVSGIVTYDHEAKVLTLENANITGQIGIKNETIENLKINLIGENTINSKGGMGTCLQHFVATEINGISGASLTANSEGNLGLYMFEAPLSIKNCNIETSGSRWGIAGEKTTADKLTIENATVKATGTMKGSIADITSLTLIDCSITAPAGAAFDENLGGVALNGELVKTQVLIEANNGNLIFDNTENKLNNISIYPNPVENLIEINIDNSKIINLDLYIYDMLGNLITQQKINEQKILLNVRNLEKGIYIVRIGSKSQRFVKL